MVKLVVTMVRRALHTLLNILLVVMPHSVMIKHIMIMYYILRVEPRMKMQHGKQRVNKIWVLNCRSSINSI